MKCVELFHGDCFDAMPCIDTGSIDMILADLPYGTTRNDWDMPLDMAVLWAEYSRLIKPNGAVVLFSQGVFTARLILSNESWFKYKLVWEKSKSTNFLNAKKQPLRKHEDVCVFYTRSPTYNPQMAPGKAYDKGIRKDQLTGSYGDFAPAHVKSAGGRYPSDIIYFKTAESETERAVLHPTQKPVALCEYLIRTYSNPGGLVLDNCMGSGTTGVACLNTGRRFIGIEKDAAIFAVAQQRIADMERRAA